MSQVQRWAIENWTNNTKSMLRGRNVGSKRWWNIINEKQGNNKETTIPPLKRENGSLANQTQDKIEMFAEYFSKKMTVPIPKSKIPHLPKLSKDTLANIYISEREVYKTLTELDET